jgi:hypothetical protein
MPEDHTTTNLNNPTQTMVPKILVEIPAQMTEEMMGFNILNHIA